MGSKKLGLFPNELCFGSMFSWKDGTLEQAGDGCFLLLEGVMLLKANGGTPLAISLLITYLRTERRKRALAALIHWSF